MSDYISHRNDFETNIHKTGNLKCVFFPVLAQQKMDYGIAAGMQFTVGDRCQVRAHFCCVLSRTRSTEIFLR